MSNQDSFIDEVTEEVRRDKLFAAFRRYGPYAIAIVVILVGVTAFYEWREATDQAAAERTGDAVLAAMSSDSPQERAEAISGLEIGDSAERAALLMLMTAAAQTDAGEREAAVATLLTLADDGEAPELYRELAALKAMILGSGQIAPDERISRLEGLAQAGRPFRLLAKEQIAIAELEAGQTEQALETLQAILSDSQVTQDLRQRASQLIVALGGSLAAT